MNYLEHHGIKGQRWGVRRFQNKDGTLTEIGKRRQFGYRDISVSKNTYSKTPRKSRTKEDREMIRKIQKWDDNERKHVFRGKQFVHNAKIMSFKLGRAFDDVDSKSGLPLIKKDETKEQTLQKVNPSKGSHLASSGNNCCLCTIAYDMRRRGYDVIADQHAPINLLYDVGPEDVSWMYGFPKETKTNSANGLERALSKEPEGSRGAAFCRWDSGSGGHVVAYEIEKGKPVLYDCQSGERYSKVTDLFDNVHNTSFIRLDDKEPNYNYVKIALQ